MHIGRLLETILTILMLAFILLVLLGTLLVLEVVNFVIGQPISWPYKLGTFAYLGMIFVIISFVGAKKILRLVRTG